MCKFNLIKNNLTCSFSICKGKTQMKMKNHTLYVTNSNIYHSLYIKNYQKTIRKQPETNEDIGKRYAKWTFHGKIIANSPNQFQRYLISLIEKYDKTRFKHEFQRLITNFIREDMKEKGTQRF